MSFSFSFCSPSSSTSSFEDGEGLLPSSSPPPSPSSRKEIRDENNNLVLLSEETGDQEIKRVSNVNLTPSVRRKTEGNAFQSWWSWRRSGTPRKMAGGGRSALWAAIAVACAFILAIDQSVGERISPMTGFRWLSSPWSWQRFFLCAIICAVLIGNAIKGFWIVVETLPRDLVFVSRIFKVAFAIAYAKWKNYSMVETFEETAKNNPDKKMIIFVDENGHKDISFSECNRFCNQVGNFFKSKGFGKGDVLAVCLENRLDHTGIWMGLAKIGAVGSLTNTNIRGQSLVHTLDVVKAKGILFSNETELAVSEVIDELPSDFNYFKVDPEPVSEKFPNLKKRATLVSELIKKQSTEKPMDRPATLNDPIMYVFTSGTTGLPKAATIKHSRYFLMGWALYGMCGFDGDKDIVYTTLPLYHSSANGLVTGSVMVGGLTMVLRKKFSASNFWKDCVNHGVTVAQYIGEVARYLYSTPPNEWEKKQKVRVLFGNGLRAQIWDQVRERFGVDIIEFYGSTEGNCSMVNLSNRKGAIGFISRIFPFLIPIRLVKVDPDTNELLRDPKTGLCIQCQPGEPGELVSPIHRGNPIRDYDGYVAKKETNKKIISDVLKKGDICFRSGDLIEMDDLGFFYFLDRCGDTFRWKGENVSTTEVESLLSKVLGDKDVAVYGALIPGSEGRAGMAAIAMGEKMSLDFHDFFQKMEELLPFYARPVFLRIAAELETTTTFKLKKTNLQKVGYDWKQTKDQIFVVDKAKKTYVPMDQDLFDKISKGQMKF